MIVAQFIVGACSILGGYRAMELLIGVVKRKEIDVSREQAEKAQRKALDSSIRWAYVRGAHDFMSRRPDYDIDTEMALAVADFRLEYGEDLREVSE